MSQGYTRFSGVNFIFFFHIKLNEKVLQSIKTHASYLQRRIFEQII